MKKLILEGHINVPKEDLEAVMAELQNHTSLTKNETGCIYFSVDQRSNDTCVFDVYEEFESKEAFESHQSRVRSSKWGSVTVNVSRHYVTKEIKS